MNILAIGKGLFQRGDVGDMRRQPEFDLAIVGSKDDIPRRGDKGLPDLPADGGTDRNILQVRFGRGQAPGLRATERIGRVDAPGLRVDLFLQRVGISGLEFCQLPPVDHFLRNRLAIAGQPLEHRDIGRILPRLAFFAALQAELAEKDFSQLLRAADREALSGKLVDLLFQFFHFLGKGRRES